MNNLAITFGLMFFAVGLLLAIGSWGAHMADTRIMEEGVTTVAHVTQVSGWSDEDGKVHVDYLFKTRDGAEISRTYSIDKAEAKQLKRGDAITIHYHPDNPKRSYPHGYGMLSQTGAIAFSLFGLIFVVFGAALVIGAWRQSHAGR